MNESLIFEEALKRVNPAERAAYLDGVCGNNAALRNQVEALLRAGDQNGSFMEKPAGNLEATVDVPVGRWIDPATPNLPEDKAGTLIGSYKLLQKIGEGGMGTVWMAEQQEPVRRMVAVKLVKAGMDSDKVVARFEAERQALALMDHPNIARIFDAGLAGNRPYFVMELVKGTPITTYCDEHRLSPNQRLELFVAVCAAIQHAHQKGIIHRDIKPNNVLVAPYDGRPVVKVIDFGVAKATGQRLTDKTMYTEFGAIVGTLEYMSPEQAELNNQDIDTRSDIYALGVLLYELLTGSTPLNRKSLKQQAMLEMLRIVREVEPQKPSTRLSTDDALPSISAQRHTDPAKMAKLMKGELDWIVMKSLEKDRNRRYETANGFGMDIQRYLDGEVVLAHPPSTAYRFKKFVQKNRSGVLVASAFFWLMAGAVGTGAYLSVRATNAEKVAMNERDNAIEAQKAEAEQRQLAEAKRRAAVKAIDAERAAKFEAEASEKRAEELNDSALALLSFVKEDLLGSARSEKDGGLGKEVPVRKALECAELKIAALFHDRPWAEASIRSAFGETYTKWGDWQKAAHQYELATELCRSFFGPDDKFTAQMIGAVGESYMSGDKFEKAIPPFREAIPKLSATFGPDHEFTRDAIEHLIHCHEKLGQFRESEEWRKKLVEIGPRNRDSESPRLADAYALLGLNLLQQQKCSDAELVLLECLAIREKMEPDAWKTFNTYSMLGRAMLGQKKYADAEPLLLKGYEGMKAREKTIPKGAEIRIPETLDRLIELYIATNKPDEAAKWRAERAKYPDVLPMPREVK